MTKTQAFRLDDDFDVISFDGGCQVVGSNTRYVYFSGSLKDCKKERENLLKLKEKTNK